MPLKPTQIALIDQPYETQPHGRTTEKNCVRAANDKGKACLQVQARWKGAVVRSGHLENGRTAKQQGLNTWDMWLSVKTAMCQGRQAL